MLVAAFDAFVQKTDQSVGKERSLRLDIAIYGLAAEIGSVVSAIKKQLLAEGGEEDWCLPNDEIIEELGDVMWYCFSLARIANEKRPVNILALDISNLKKEIGASNARALRIRTVLERANADNFLKAAETFPRKARKMQFEDYQSLAFLTARTQDRTLIEVCLAVLWQLSAELFRLKLPKIELELNKTLMDRNINDTLGEIAWHISALASTYKCSLSDVAQRNMEKVSFRLDRTHPTPLHDDSYDASQQFPRKFEVAFVSIAQDKCRMYLDGRRLGDDLNDNAYEEDGYRYHDIMHLANIAKLGWSPVFRKLMDRKRRRSVLVDNVEDGARAGIVEELVIKAIHSEGERLAGLKGQLSAGQPRHLFANASDVTFRFLKFLRGLVVGLEVEKNRYWEWEDAVREGNHIFYCLRCETQGTVEVDLNRRSITFRPEVCIDLNGTVTGLGSACLDTNMISSTDAVSRYIANAKIDGLDEDHANRLIIQKLAILDSLGFHNSCEHNMASITVTEVNKGGVSVRARDLIQNAIWERKVIAFRTTISKTSSTGYHCMAIALTDERGN